METTDVSSPAGTAIAIAINFYPYISLSLFKIRSPGRLVSFDLDRSLLHRRVSFTKKYLQNLIFHGIDYHSSYYRWSRGLNYFWIATTKSLHQLKMFFHHCYCYSLSSWYQAKVFFFKMVGLVDFLIIGLQNLIQISNLSAPGIVYFSYFCDKFRSVTHLMSNFSLGDL